MPIEFRDPPSLTQVTIHYTNISQYQTCQHISLTKSAQHISTPQRLNCIIPHYHFHKNLLLIKIVTYRERATVEIPFPSITAVILEGVDLAVCFRV